NLHGVELRIRKLDAVLVSGRGCFGLAGRGVGMRLPTQFGFRGEAEMPGAGGRDRNRHKSADRNARSASRHAGKHRFDRIWSRRNCSEMATMRLRRLLSLITELQ